MRPTDRNSFQKAAERKFPIKVDIPVPPGGLGRRLTGMLDWCHANVAAGAWAEHGHQVRKKGERPADFARWYFMSDTDAEAFRRRWCDSPAPLLQRERGSAMPPLTKRMQEVLLSADLSSGTVNNVPHSTMHGLEARGLITDEWRKRWSIQISESGRFPHHGGRLTEEGIRLAQSLRRSGH